MALGTFFSSLIVQFVFELYPCPLCIVQRVLYGVVGIILLQGLVLSPHGKLVPSLGIFAALTTVGVAIYQGWIASPEALAECGAPGPMETVLWWLAENVSYPVFAPEASCAEAAGHDFLWMPMPFWSVLAGSGIALMLVLALRHRS